ncbi:unnamed protein product [Linum trigynum]|uniref:TIR domain-containing protein n=1 Tax=Linum trigynum TaxID=586398 RepID=A0AAV2D4J7_9ROSI
MESSAAASSSSALPQSVALPAGDYEVFMSFRGPDVRNKFASHLYTSLKRAKIRTFRDEEELQKGEGIAPSLVLAIPDSKIYIPILSEQYASSKWCLLELAQMVECWKQGKGHIILPIFYFVNPRDVRHQQGSYQQAFEQHTHKHSPEIVKEWKEALREVGQMKGWHVTESCSEGTIVDEVLSKVESHLMSMYTLVTDELVGIDTPVEEVMELLDLGSSDEKVTIGIHGMGGLGKTTLSKAVYNTICSKFDRCCYLEDVREALAKSNGVVSLMNRIISTILKAGHQVKSASEGINMIKERVSKHKLLLVLDDIDDKFEFDKILGKLSDFSAGSRFIFTTRYKRALDFIPECKFYEPKEMSRHLSLQLFCKHAFGINNPPEEDAEICDEFVEVAAGLPLALKVIGSLLFHRGREFWEEKLKEYRGIASTTENVLQERLKISYNDLSHNEKQIFLDIACFFIGEEKDLPYYMWSGCDFYPESGIDTLIHRSLMKLEENNRFWMHDHIKDLGRAIVKEEDVRHPYNRSRIWSTDDALDMLRNRQGSERLEAIQIHANHNEMLESQNFEKLSGLRYLDVRYGQMMGDFSQDNWKGWSGVKAATKLKALNLVGCSMLTKSPDMSRCTSLEFINFTWCHKMEGQIHIGKFKNLKKLILHETAITELVISGGDIGNLQRLEVMDVSKTGLTELPAGMENLSSLKILSLGSTLWQATNYWIWMEIPRLPRSLKMLSILCPSFGVPNLLELKELEFLICDQGYWFLDDFWRLPNLKELNLKGRMFSCPNYGPLLRQDQDEGATSLAATAAQASITSLKVVGCSDLNELPSLENLCNLTQLRVSRVQVAEIRGLGELRALENMVISDCSNLNSLNGLENLLLLKSLTLRSVNLERLPSLANLCNLTLLRLSGVQVAEIRGLGELRALETMVISYCWNLNSLNGLENLLLLKTLTLTSVNLERLPSLANLSKLKDLDVSYCRNLVEIQGMDGLGESLSRMRIEECPRLESMDGLQLLGALEELTFFNQLFGQEPFLDLPGLVNLKRLNIRWCQELTEVKGLERLVSLELLSMTRCPSIRQLPGLSELSNLKELSLYDCGSLIDLAGINRLESLQKLRLEKCLSITRLPNLSGLKNLESLELKGCIKLTGLEGVEGLESLKELDLHDCRSITELGNLSGLKNLWRLDILCCTKLIEVNGLDELEELRYLGMERRMRRRMRRRKRIMRVKRLAKSAAARFGNRLCCIRPGYNTATAAGTTTSSAANCAIIKA